MGGISGPVVASSATGRQLAMGPQGPPGPAGASGNVGNVGVGSYGDGSDGTAVADGVATVPGFTLTGGAYVQTRDVFFVNLTLNAGITIRSRGFRTFVNGTYALNGHHSSDGGAAGSTPDGAYSPGGVICTLGFGILGATSGGDGNTNSLGGSGGQDSFGSQGGVNTPPSAGAGSPRALPFAIMGCVYGESNTLIQILGGGAGGGAGGAGPAWGGNGAGVVVVAAATLAGSGSLTANGGAGGTGGTSGGGGGGGVVFLVNRTNASSVSVTAAGGLADTAHAGAVNGSPGTVIQLST